METIRYRFSDLCSPPPSWQLPVRPLAYSRKASIFFKEDEKMMPGGTFACHVAARILSLGAARIWNAVGRRQHTQDVKRGNQEANRRARTHKAPHGKLGNSKCKGARRPWVRSTVSCQNSHWDLEQGVSLVAPANLL